VAEKQANEQTHTNTFIKYKGVVAGLQHSDTLYMTLVTRRWAIEL